MVIRKLANLVSLIRHVRSVWAVKGSVAACRRRLNSVVKARHWAAIPHLCLRSLGDRVKPVPSRATRTVLPVEIFGGGGEVTAFLLHSQSTAEFPFALGKLPSCLPSIKAKALSTSPPHKDLHWNVTCTALLLTNGLTRITKEKAQHAVLAPMPRFTTLFKPDTARPFRADGDIAAINETRSPTCDYHLSAHGIYHRKVPRRGGATPASSSRRILIPQRISRLVYTYATARSSGPQCLGGANFLWHELMAQKATYIFFAG